MKLFTCKDYGQFVENPNDDSQYAKSYLQLRQNRNNEFDISEEEMEDVSKVNFSNLKDEEVIKKIENLPIDKIMSFYLCKNFSILKMYWKRYIVLKAILEKFEKC